LRFRDVLLKGVFYEPELQKVEKDENVLWFIEKKLRKRKRTGKIQWLVKFEGWPDKYNQWINEEDISEHGLHTKTVSNFENFSGKVFIIRSIKYHVNS
jgi:vacuolar-type H+-ATPase catalytic subunit A/Vma1